MSRKHKSIGDPDYLCTDFYVTKLADSMMKSIFFAAFCLLMVVACQNASKSSNAPATAAAAIHFDNKTDPSCGMEVTPEFTDSCHYKGKVYGFCSESCKETFLGDPEKYLTGK